jgi:hypothetical protein
MGDETMDEQSEMMKFKISVNKYMNSGYSYNILQFSEQAVAEMNKPLLKSRESKKKEILKYVEDKCRQMEKDMHSLVDLASMNPDFTLPNSVYQQAEDNRTKMISLLNSLKASYDSAPLLRKGLRWSEMFVRHKYFANLIFDDKE